MPGQAEQAGADEAEQHDNARGLRHADVGPHLHSDGSNSGKDCGPDQRGEILKDPVSGKMGEPGGIRGTILAKSGLLSDTNAMKGGSPA